MSIYLMGSGKCFLGEQNNVSIVRLAGRSVDKIYEERPHRKSISNEGKKFTSFPIYFDSPPELMRDYSQQAMTGQPVI